jgi:hypothetical protein
VCLLRQFKYGGGRQKFVVQRNIYSGNVCIMTSAGDFVLPGISCLGAVVLIVVGAWAAKKAADCKSGDNCRKGALIGNATIAFVFALLTLLSSSATMALTRD